MPVSGEGVGLVVWEPGGARHCHMLMLVIQPCKLDPNTWLPKSIRHGGAQELGGEAGMGLAGKAGWMDLLKWVGGAGPGWLEWLARVERLELI